MTDSEINQAIAEACGWRKARIGTQSKSDPYPSGWCDANNNERTHCHDYCHDLNATHEAEKLLTPDQWLEYERVLARLCFIGPDGSWARLVMSATARQRAEAFLRTIGKWS